MKAHFRHLISSLLLFFTFSIQAQDSIRFDERGLELVMQHAKTENKPIFYMVYTDWCPHCKNIKATTLKDSEVISFMNANYVFAGLNFEKAGSESFKSKYNIKNFPTFLVLDTNGIELARFTGELKKEKFLSEVKIALNPKQQLPFLKAEYEKDKTNGANCMRYLVALKKGNDRKELNPIAHDYFEGIQDDKMVNEINWKIFTNGVSDIESREYRFVIVNQQAFVAITSQKRVNDKFVNSVVELLKPIVKTSDTTNYTKQRAIAKSITAPVIDSLVFQYDLDHFEANKDWTKYKKVAAENIKKYVWNSPKDIKDIVLIVMQNSTDTPSLNQSLSWIKHSNELEESYDGILLEARVQRKLNNITTAIAMTKKAKAFSTNMGWEGKEADKLLADLLERQKVVVIPTPKTKK
nr:thioredoxin fold domain-containing protein [uncultured Flavobacterium sp.]